MSEEVRKLGIGRKVRAIRERRGESLAAVSDRAKIPEVVLAQIEQDVVSPTVAALLNVARALGTSIDALLQDAPSESRIEVVRSGEGRRVQRRSSNKAALSYNYESLAYRLVGKHMEPFMVEFALDVDPPAAPVSHQGEEFLHILEGEVELTSGDERVVLRQGDSVYFHSSTPHSLRALGSVTPRALAVLYPFDDE